MTTLYKFISDADAARFLLKGSVKFTPIADLNDPSELIPNVIGEQVEESLARVRQTGYSDDDMVNLRCQERLLRLLAPRFPMAPMPETKEEATARIRSPDFDQTHLLERMLTERVEAIATQVGLLCLSSRYTSLPMWAHYSRNARGLVVAFQGLDRVFKGDDTGILRLPVAVRYEPERSGMTFDSRSHEALFIAKFKDWSYEDEVRVIMPLEACRQVMIGDKRVHLFDIPRTCIARVILGWNMPTADVEMVRKHAAAGDPIVDVVQARCIRGHVEVDPP